MRDSKVQCVAPPFPIPKEIFLGEAELSSRKAAHEARLAPWVGPHLSRRSFGETHPVYDFLFDYYSFRAALLMRWTPGIGNWMEGPSADLLLQDSSFALVDGYVGLVPERFPRQRLESVQWILSLMERSVARPAHYGCFGLHEWAMVYESEEVRYPGIPLRMNSLALAGFVRSQEICCSHHDAFRFFTESARPLNRLQPAKKTQPDFEQTGCVHVNMDLYKWAYKFYPWIGSDLIADAFLIAAEARAIDMRASPYDFSSLGFQAIAIETSAGREEYQRAQQQIRDRAAPVREGLITAYRELLSWLSVRSW